MFFRLFSCITIIIAVFACDNSICFADSNEYAILDFGTAQVNNNAFNRTIGWIFDVNTDLVVDGLGVWDDEIDGLVDDHLVGIFDFNGNLLQSANVLSGTQSQAEGPIVANGQWRFVEIADLTLFAGETYTVAALYEEDDVFESNATFVTTSTKINFIDERFSDNDSGFVFPTSTASADRSGLFGPNFRISVPEPSSFLVLAGTGMAAVVARRRRTLIGT